MSLTANNILAFLDQPTLQRDISLVPSDINNQNDNSFMWAKNANYASKIEQGFLVLSEVCYQEIEPKPKVTYIQVSSNPRLVYLKVLSHFIKPDRKAELQNFVEIHRSNTSLIIGQNVFIGENVTIGDGTIIHDNCTILANSVIGANCFIKSFTSISTEGLGFEKVEGKWVKFPQIGNTIIEDNCEIGPHTTIRRSALGSTIVKKGSKIGSFCNIGHNCVIGENTLLTSNCILAGSSTIGDNTYLGVSCSIRNGIHIGKNATVGMGSVVVKNVLENQTVIGNPAKVISK